MKTPERKLFEEKQEIRLGGVPDDLEELVLQVATTVNLIMLASIGLVVYVMYLLGW